MVPRLCLHDAPHVGVRSRSDATQEEEDERGYQEVHPGARIDSNYRRNHARSFGYERIRGASLFDDPRSKESEIYYRSSVWDPIGKGVAVPTGLEADGMQYSFGPDKARGAVAQHFRRKSEPFDELVVVSLWMPHIEHAATHAPFQLILSRIVDAVEAAAMGQEQESGSSVKTLPFIFGGDWNELGYRGRLKKEAEAAGFFSIGDRRFYNLMFEMDADGNGYKQRDGCKYGTMQQRGRMCEVWDAVVQGDKVVGAERMKRFPFAVSTVPTDNILFSCVEEEEVDANACHELTSTVQCDYDQFASDHVPVEATVTARRGGPIKVVSWNVGGSDLTYFYGAQPDHLGPVQGTLIKFAADELTLAPDSLELLVTEATDVIDETVVESEDGRVVATEGTRWVTVGWPANVNAGLAKIFAGDHGSSGALSHQPTAEDEEVKAHKRRRTVDEAPADAP